MDELSDLVYQNGRLPAALVALTHAHAPRRRPSHENYVCLPKAADALVTAHSLHLLRTRAISTTHGRSGAKRGGDARQVTLEEGRIAGDGMHEADFLLLDEAMRELARHDLPRHG